MLKNIVEGLPVLPRQDNALQFSSDQIESDHLPLAWIILHQSLENIHFAVDTYRWHLMFRGQESDSVLLGWDVPEITHSYTSFTFANIENSFIRLVISIEFTNYETGEILTVQHFDGQMQGGKEQKFLVPLNAGIEGTDHIRMLFQIFPGSGSSADTNHGCFIWDPTWHFKPLDQAQNESKGYYPPHYPADILDVLRGLLAAGGHTLEINNVAQSVVPHKYTGDIFVDMLPNIVALFLLGLDEGRFSLAEMPTIRHFIFHLLDDKIPLISLSQNETEFLTRVQPARETSFGLPHSILNSLLFTENSLYNPIDWLKKRIDLVPRNLKFVKEEIEYFGSLDHPSGLTELEKFFLPLHKICSFEKPSYWNTFASILINFDRHGYLRCALDRYNESQALINNRRFKKLLASLAYTEMRQENTYLNLSRSKNEESHFTANTAQSRPRAIVFRPHDAHGIAHDAMQVKLLLKNVCDVEFVSYSEEDNRIYFATDGPTNSDFFVVCADPIRAHKILLKIYREFDERRCVGVIPWEFPEFPEETLSTLKRLDKIFCPSKFCSDIFVEAGLKNVATFPNLLLEKQPNELKKLSNPWDDNFLFFSHVNLASGVNRKNPFGFIEAARKIIANGIDCKFLLRVLVTNSSQSEDLADIVKVAKDLPNFIVETSDNDDKRFFQSGIEMADCFVSLHRSEGFGRQIAEAMGLKTPVICSNYSGNLDYCNPRNSYLVDGNLRACQPGEYFGNTSLLTWFEPDIEHAAVLMQQVISKPQQRKQKIEAAHKLITEKFSISNKFSLDFLGHLDL